MVDGSAKPPREIEALFVASNEELNLAGDGGILSDFSIGRLGERMSPKNIARRTKRGIPTKTIVIPKIIVKIMKRKAVFKFFFFSVLFSLEYLLYALFIGS